ncbi:MAG TPA: iron uptake transporter deferrochelatase/peroxidase subunit [Marmoricola sp.]|nr:deferrochelatase/peroxidase EfeB [Nocardioidaceae bacterium]MCO5325338.1 iron uptake transporter deferrochelatase/peroxidase subunit [Nocardioidaceae bacterium]HMY08437.1 iron uptake transporter deferrochelatase/peroxidase subunit [Marmoricola sp.]HRV69375.1 iron uptake transporter deferrochelatase/peroxidase subunit [Marmoricola sp.]
MSPSHGFTRRGLLGTAGVGAVAAGAAACGVGAKSAKSTAGGSEYPFEGAHQAGIVTPAQDRLHFAAFDMTTESREDLISLLQDWTDAARAVVRGEEIGADTPTTYGAPFTDTGEAIGLPASGLTITIGFGPSLFTKGGKARFGLEGKQPKALRELPHFPADNLDPARSGGDLCVQACAHDPQVAVHAIRNLSRIAFGRAAIRWAQLGFGRTSSTSTKQATPRNLFGFKDGTANLKAEEAADLDKFVWVQPGDDSGAEWMAGGSYLVARRINMHIETWDRSSAREQENIVGRDRLEGAPLSGGKEFTEPDFDLKGRDGPIIPVNSHMRLAHPDFNNGTKMLRRGYNFTDGSNSLGRLDAGLFFIAFVRDPDTHYIPMQTTLAAQDAMMEYLQHTGSGLFAVPPGVKKGEYVGQSLFT